MNPRIELVNDYQVRVFRSPKFVMTLQVSVIDGEQQLTIDGKWGNWDAEGRAALIDALQCLRDTGSFAALADTSAVPFLNKQLTHVDRNYGVVTVVNIFPHAPLPVWTRDAAGRFVACTYHELLPLAPPARKITPWTAETAFTQVPPNTHVMDTLTGEDCVVSRFTSWSGGWDVAMRHGQRCTPEYLAANCKLTTGEPCGILEPQPWPRPQHKKQQLLRKEPMETNLRFYDLRMQNTARLPHFRNRRGLLAHREPDGSDWCLAQWCNAVCGELGEAANIIKKIEREDFTLMEARLDLANELADVVTYIDLLAFRAGIDLGLAVKMKFNAVSDRVGCDIRL